jgi:hypothetical protein
MILHQKIVFFPILGGGGWGLAKWWCNIELDKCEEIETFVLWSKNVLNIFLLSFWINVLLLFLLFTLWKESLWCSIKQTITSHLDFILNTHKKTTYDARNLDPGTAQTCGRVKPVNGIRTLPLDNWISNGNTMYTSRAFWWSLSRKVKLVDSINIPHQYTQVLLFNDPFIYSMYRGLCQTRGPQ